MSERDRGSEVHDCGGDVAAYALRALDPKEAEVFRAHLETCVACRTELEELQGVVDVLPLSAPQHRAPRRMRRQVIETIRDESKPAAHTRPRGAFARLAASATRKPALTLSAGLAVVAIIVAGVELSTPDSTKPRVYSAQVTGQGSARVTVTGTHAELIVRHFSPPPPGQIYEVWLERAGHPPAPTGALFTVTGGGDGEVGVRGNLHGVTTVMVTPEPAGGTRVPTHPAVIRAQLS